MDSATEWRGGQAQLLYLLRGMERQGQRALVAAPATGALSARLQRSVFPISSGNNPAAVWQLRRIVSRCRPDLVAAHTSHAHGVCVMAGLRPVVHRRVDFAVGATRIGRWKYSRARLFLAVSQAVARVLVRGGVPVERITVVHDGVQPLPEAKPAHDLAGRRPLVGAVGALVDHKGHRHLVAAMALLPGLRCVIAGEGPLRGALSEQIRALGLQDRVQLLGQRQDIPAVLAALDLMVHPSVEEGMGQVVVEAMGAGVPVLATDAGGLPEVVGSEACVPLGDAAALARGIERRLVQPGDLQAARRRARERFSVERMVAGTITAYGHALDPGRTAAGAPPQPERGGASDATTP